MALSSPSKSRRRTENKRNTARGRHNCRQASVFKRSSQNQCVIELVDEHGNQSFEVQEGRLNEISHQAILRALEHRASCYKCKEKVSSVDDNLVSWALDETGTIDSTLLLNRTEMNERMALVELQEKVMVEELGILDKVLNSLTPKSVPAGTKLVLFGRYVLNIYVGIV
jgi:hypothetical protein